jgi:hypothetical protein
MTTQEQAYIEGFVKRASEYGFNYNEAINLLKQATLQGKQYKLDVNHNGKIEADDLKALRNRKKTVKTAAPGLVTGGTGAATMPKVNPAMQNEKIMQPKQRAFNQDPRTGRTLSPAELAKANE